ncbi:MAG: AMP-binding protein [Alphaproteobacteria bacterium]
MDLGSAFDAAVARAPGALAFVDGEHRRDFVGWQVDIRRLAGGLAARGIGRGDHVLALMSNRYEMASLYWAAQMLGAVFTPFNWRASADEIAYVIEDAEARVVVFDAGAADAARAAVVQTGFDPDAVIAVDGGAETSFASLLDAAPVAGPVGAAESDICLMLYTSGTTGRPKGVPRSHRAERTAALSCIANLRYRPRDASLGVMPLFHTMGIRILLCGVMLNGAFIAMRAFDAGKALKLIGDERIAALFLVPTLFHDMLAHPDCAKGDFSPVTNVAYAGMAMTGALERRCREVLRPEIFANYYGSSEIFTFTLCDHLDRKPGCAGPAGINQIIRVVTADPEGKATPDDVLPPGEVGEVIATMQSPEAFTGYWKRPDADARAIRGGWYFTGDLGYVDEDGALFLSGRIDDMIISGGENIHPEEVEDTLADCALVRQAAVVGLPDERFGQLVTAFIEPAGPETSAGALDAHCRASALARFKRPRAYVFVAALPRSASGKLLRRLLRDGAYETLTDHDITL